MQRQIQKTSSSSSFQPTHFFLVFRYILFFLVLSIVSLCRYIHPFDTIADLAFSSRTALSVSNANKSDIIALRKQRLFGITSITVRGIHPITFLGVCHVLEDGDYTSKVMSINDAMLLWSTLPNLVILRVDKGSRHSLAECLMHSTDHGLTLLLE